MSFDDAVDIALSEARKSGFKGIQADQFAAGYLTGLMHHPSHDIPAPDRIRLAFWIARRWHSSCDVLSTMKLIEA
ncbi:hypothetical protein D0Q53_20780 [Salmonella enterica]|nr:hypothetical protein [Salmonella enterica]EFF4796165.1 hypothetical protein [Escherichia coli]EBL0923966.1 hypothetical protein [Salmonella enterica]ECO7324758.1 hypothetical protein [Salmonella enterica]EHF0215338.1 hypothetical protein [Salmonella enterica]